MSSVLAAAEGPFAATPDDVISRSTQAPETANHFPEEGQNIFHTTRRVTSVSPLGTQLDFNGGTAVPKPLLDPAMVGVPRNVEGGRRMPQEDVQKAHVLYQAESVSSSSSHPQEVVAPMSEEVPEATVATETAAIVTHVSESSGPEVVVESKRSLVEMGTALLAKAGEAIKERFILPVAEFVAGKLVGRVLSLHQRTERDLGESRLSLSLILRRLCGMALNGLDNLAQMAVIEAPNALADNIEASVDEIRTELAAARADIQQAVYSVLHPGDAAVEELGTDPGDDIPGFLRPVMYAFGPCLDENFLFTREEAIDEIAAQMRAERDRYYRNTAFKVVCLASLGMLLLGVGSPVFAEISEFTKEQTRLQIAYEDANGKVEVAGERDDGFDHFVYQSKYDDRGVVVDSEGGRGGDSTEDGYVKDTVLYRPDELIWGTIRAFVRGDGENAVFGGDGDYGGDENSYNVGWNAMDKLINLFVGHSGEPFDGANPVDELPPGYEFRVLENLKSGDRRPEASGLWVRPDTGDFAAEKPGVDIDAKVGIVQVNAAGVVQKVIVEGRLKAGYPTQFGAEVDLISGVDEPRPHIPQPPTPPGPPEELPGSSPRPSGGAMSVR